MICSNCEKKLTGSSNYCSNCGSPKWKVIEKPRQMACYLCVKNGKSIFFSSSKKYKKHLKTEHFLIG